MMIYINIFKHTCTKGQQNNPSGKIGIQIYMRHKLHLIWLWMFSIALRCMIECIITVGQNIHCLKFALS